MYSNGRILYSIGQMDSCSLFSIFQFWSALYSFGQLGSFSLYSIGGLGSYYLYSIGQIGSCSLYSIGQIESCSNFFNWSDLVLLSTVYSWSVWFIIFSIL